MKKNNILLINPPLYFDRGLPYSLDVSVPPLGLLYLASYINHYSKEFKASILDVTAEKLAIEDILKKIGNEKPFVIGLTSMTPQLQGTVELAETLKKVFPDIKIFLGGPHVSADPSFIDRFKFFDYAITGEAEVTFLDSLLKLKKEEKIPKIQSGKVVGDLDRIPLPNRSLIKREKYNQQESMMFSRGCPYNCYYCSRPSISKKIRYRSVENLIKEIKSTRQFCQGKIDFQDDTFTMNKNKVIEFCQAVIDNNLKLEWRCNSRIDLVDEELLSTMAKSGCKLIHFGIEAGNEKIRKEVVKKGNFTNKQIYEVIVLCKKYRIKFGGYFMVGHPGETKKNLKETQDMILGSGMDLLGLSIPTPFPGSALYNIAEKEGVISKKIIDQFATKKLGLGYVGNYPIYVSNKLSKQVVFEFMKNTNRKFYLNSKTLFIKLFEDIGSPRKLLSDAFDFFALLVNGVSSRKPYINKKE